MVKQPPNNASLFSAEQIEKQKGWLFVLSSKKDTGWVKDGYMPNDPNAPKITYAASLSLPIRSRVWMGKEFGGWVDTQYVEGSPTIYSKTLKDRAGVVIHYGHDHYGYDLRKEYQNTMGKSIQFKDGILNLNDFGFDMQLREFVLNHEFNEDRPGFKEVFPGSNRNPAFKFCIMVKEQKATAAITKIQDSYNAIGIALSLRKETADGCVYDLAKIDAILDMLNVGGGLLPEEPEQKISMIALYAASKPLEFSSIIESEIEAMKLAIGTSHTLGVIKINKKGVSFKDEQATFIDFKGTSERDAVEDLAYYFLSKKGQENFEKMEQARVVLSMNAAKN